MVNISQMHSTTKSEFYDFHYGGRNFQVEYLSRATEFDGKAEPYDDMVHLGEVLRDLTSGQNLVQIRQWRDLPTGLENVLNSLPPHVKDLLKMEYSDSNIIPYDFGMTFD